MKKHTPTPRVIASVWHHWKPAFSTSKTMLAGTFLCYSIAMYFEMMFRPTQMKKVFDALSVHASPWQPFYFIIIASIMGWIFNRSGDICIVFAESRIIRSLKDYCMEGLLGKSTTFFTKKGSASGSLVAKSKRFAHVSEHVIDEFAFSLVKSTLFVIYLLVYTSILMQYLLVPLVIWLTLFVSISVMLSHVQMKYDLKSSEADSVTTSHISDILSSLFTLRMYSAVARVQKTFGFVTKEEETKRRNAWLFSNMQWAFQAILVIALELYCIGTTIGNVESGATTIGTAALVQSYIMSLTMYMWTFGRSIIKVRTACAEAYEMAEMLEEENSEPITGEPLQSISENKGISFSGVTFGYTDQVQTLSDFSFTFSSGRKYGIIGKTGSGKSTLTKLMLRAFHHHHGKIHIGNQRIEDVNKLLLRSWIAYVPQDPHFPSWKVKDIIALGKPNASPDEIRIAAEKAQCGFIWEKLPSGFDTEIGERGVLLSGGERQRLAIAAAILKDAPIVIMDEPTSALDAYTEHCIQSVIKTYFSGKTLIVIAHRLSTVAVLDEIILIENGTVKDFGPHTSLLQSSPDYAQMWELQTNPHIA